MTQPLTPEELEALRTSGLQPAAFVTPQAPVAVMEPPPPAPQTQEVPPTLPQFDPQGQERRDPWLPQFDPQGQNARDTRPQQPPYQAPPAPSVVAPAPPAPSEPPDPGLASDRGDPLSDAGISLQVAAGGTDPLPDGYEHVAPSEWQPDYWARRDRIKAAQDAEDAAQARMQATATTQNVHDWRDDRNAAYLKATQANDLANANLGAQSIHDYRDDRSAALLQRSQAYDKANTDADTQDLHDYRDARANAAAANATPPSSYAAPWGAPIDGPLTAGAPILDFLGQLKDGALGLAGSAIQSRSRAVTRAPLTPEQAAQHPVLDAAGTALGAIVGDPNNIASQTLGGPANPLSQAKADNLILSKPRNPDGSHTDEQRDVLDRMAQSAAMFELGGGLVEGVTGARAVAGATAASRALTPAEQIEAQALNRTLGKQFHPDLHPDIDPAIQKQINVAYGQEDLAGLDKLRKLATDNNITVTPHQTASADANVSWFSAAKQQVSNLVDRARPDFSGASDLGQRVKAWVGRNPAAAADNPQVLVLADRLSTAAASGDAAAVSAALRPLASVGAHIAGDPVDSLSPVGNATTSAPGDVPPSVSSAATAADGAGAPSDPGAIVPRAQAAPKAPLSTLAQKWVNMYGTPAAALGALNTHIAGVTSRGSQVPSALSDVAAELGAQVAPVKPEVLDQLASLRAEVAPAADAAPLIGPPSPARDPMASRVDQAEYQRIRDQANAGTEVNFDDLGAPSAALDAYGQVATPDSAYVAAQRAYFADPSPANKAAVDAADAAMGPAPAAAPAPVASAPAPAAPDSSALQAAWDQLDVAHEAYFQEPSPANKAAVDAANAAVDRLDPPEVAVAPSAAQPEALTPLQIRNRATFEANQQANIASNAARAAASGGAREPAPVGSGYDYMDQMPAGAVWKPGDPTPADRWGLGPNDSEPAPEPAAPDTKAQLAEINRVRDRVVMADQQDALNGDTAARTRIETAETTAKRQSARLLRSVPTADLESMLGQEAHALLYPRDADGGTTGRHPENLGRLTGRGGQDYVSQELSRRHQASTALEPAVQRVLSDLNTATRQPSSKVVDWESAAATLTSDPQKIADLVRQATATPSAADAAAGAVALRQQTLQALKTAHDLNESIRAMKADGVDTTSQADRLTLLQHLADTATRGLTEVAGASRKTSQNAATVMRSMQVAATAQAARSIYEPLDTWAKEIKDIEPVLRSIKNGAPVGAAETKRLRRLATAGDNAKNAHGPTAAATTEAIAKTLANQDPLLDLAKEIADLSTQMAKSRDAGESHQRYRSLEDQRDALLDDLHEKLTAKRTEAITRARARQLEPKGPLTPEGANTAQAKDVLAAARAQVNARMPVNPEAEAGKIGDAVQTKVREALDKDKAARLADVADTGTKIYDGILKEIEKERNSVSGPVFTMDLRDKILSALEKDHTNFLTSLQRGIQKEITRAQVQDVVDRIRTLATASKEPNAAAVAAQSASELLSQLQDMGGIASDRASAIRESLQRQNLLAMAGRAETKEQMDALLHSLTALNPDNPAEIQRFIAAVRGAPNFLQYVREYTYINLLMSMTTHSKVLASHFLWAALRALDTPLAAGYDHFVHQGQNIPWATVGNAGSASMAGLKEGARSAGQIMTTGNEAGVLARAATLGEARGVSTEALSNPDNMPGPEAMRNLMAGVFEKLHQLSDRPERMIYSFIGHALYGGIQAELATITAQAELKAGNLSGTLDEAFYHVLSHIWDYPDIVAAAGHQTEDALTRGPTALSEALNRLKRIDPKDTSLGSQARALLATQIIPFSTIPIGLAKAGGLLSLGPIPGMYGLYRALRPPKDAEGNRPPPDRVKEAFAAASIIKGTVIAALSLAEVLSGHVDADGPESEHDKQIWETEGHRPWSWKPLGILPRVDIGDMPWGMLMGTMANVKEGLEKDKHKPDSIGALNVLGSVVHGLIGTWSSNSVVKMLQGPFEMLSTHTIDWSKWAAQQAAHFVPAETGLGWLAQMGDGTARKPSGFFENIEANIPGLRQNTAIDPDALGRPQQSPRGFDLGALAAGRVPDNIGPALGDALLPFHPSDSPLVNDRVLTALAASDVAVPERITRIANRVGNKEIDMTPQEQAQYHRIAGAEVERRVLADLADPKWVSYDKQHKADLLNKDVSLASTYAKSAMIASIPDADFQRRAINSARIPIPLPVRTPVAP
jgi:hypothetical protein